MEKGSGLVLAFVPGLDAPFLAVFSGGRVLVVTLGGEQITELPWQAGIPIQPCVEAGREARGCHSATSSPPARGLPSAPLTCVDIHPPTLR